MKLAAAIAVGFVAFLHVYFCVLEAFLWRTPFGRKVTRFSKEHADATAVMAQNQAVYNLFLAAGLVWGLAAAPPFAHQLQLFFLGCVFVAGLVGAATASAQIFFVQSVPAGVAGALVLLAAR